MVIIEDFIVLNNDFGFVVGMYLRENNYIYVLLLGLLFEMKLMFISYVNLLFLSESGD